MPTIAPYARFGTLSISDLLRVNNTAVIDFGRQDVFRVLALYFEETNRIVNEQLALFSDRITLRAEGVGGTVATQAYYVDEFGVSPPQQVGGVAQIGYPLRKHQVVRQWTSHWMRKHTPAEMAAQAQAAAIADMQKVQSALRRAIFIPTNFTFTDRLVDNMQVFVKSFANADGFPIPASPAGTTFDATTHTHYTGTVNTWPSPSDLGTLLTNVSEHFSAGKLYLFVNQAFGDYMIANRASTYTEFAILQYVDQQYATTLTLGRGALAALNPQNRQIGVYRGAEVWVKPWVPTGVAWAFCDAVRPLAMRIPDDIGGDNGDFRPVWDDIEYPLECEVLEREYGFGVRNRIAGAVMSYSNPDTNYVAPTTI